MRFTDHTADFYTDSFDIEDIPCTVQWELDGRGVVTGVEFYTASLAEPVMRSDLVKFFGENAVHMAEERIREQIQEDLKDYTIAAE